MKLFWQGTDSLMLVDYSMRKLRKRPYWWLFRRIIWFLDRFYVAQHYVDSGNLIGNLKRFGVRKPVDVFPDKINKSVYEKLPHDTFTVLYYLPTGGDKGFRDWLYGRDIFEAVVSRFPEFRYIVVGGDSDMKYVYPYVDFYLRPNRHDGASRMRQECELNNIPYYWTQKDPNAEDAIKKINEYKW